MKYTNGINSIDVTAGAYREIYEPLGYYEVLEESGEGLDSVSPYHDLKMDKLRKMARNRGIDCTGLKKADLVSGLDCSDQQELMVNRDMGSDDAADHGGEFDAAT